MEKTKTPKNQNPRQPEKNKQMQPWKTIAIKLHGIQLHIV